MHDDAPLALRQRLALAWAEMYARRPRACRRAARAGRGIAQSPRFDAADRAEVLYRQGCVALKRHRVAEAISLFTRALETNEHVSAPASLLAANAHQWRSRCYQVRRDWDAARPRRRGVARARRRDAGCEPRRRHALFQASLIAERRSALAARALLRRAGARDLPQLGDTLSTARILNNLGGIDFLLGDVEAAEQLLIEAAATARRPAATPTSRRRRQLARTGAPAHGTGPGGARPRTSARLELLAGRADFLDEIGNAQLVVARSLAAEGEPRSAVDWLDEAERTFDGSVRRATSPPAWSLRGDLRSRHGRPRPAADLYRRAAESLQDVHF